MKIAIASKSNSLDGIINGRFERSKWLIIINTDNNEFGFYSLPHELNDKNQIIEKTSKDLSDQKVTIILTESCGPKALQILNQAGLKAYNASDMTIIHAIEKFKNNKLRELQSASLI